MPCRRPPHSQHRLRLVPLHLTMDVDAKRVVGVPGLLRPGPLEQHHCGKRSPTARVRGELRREGRSRNRFRDHPMRSTRDGGTMPTPSGGEKEEVVRTRTCIVTWDPWPRRVTTPVRPRCRHPVTEERRPCLRLWRTCVVRRRKEQGGDRSTRLQVYRLRAGTVNERNGHSANLNPGLILCAPCRRLLLDSTTPLVRGTRVSGSLAQERSGPLARR